MTLSPAAKVISPQKDECKTAEVASVAVSNAKITAEEPKELEPIVKHVLHTPEEKCTEQARTETISVRWVDVSHVISMFRNSACLLQAYCADVL